MTQHDTRAAEGKPGTALAKVDANRRNAPKSTGPRSAEGKAIARLNALKHGLLSGETVLAGESAGDLEDLGRRLHEELQPVGELEALLVDRIVSCLWRLRRALQAEAAEIDQSRLELVEEREAPRVYGGTDPYADALQEAEGRLESAEETLAWLREGGDPYEGDMEEDSPLADLFETLADEHFEDLPQGTRANAIRHHARTQGWTAEKLRHAFARILRAKIAEARTALGGAQALGRAHEHRQEQIRRLVLVAQGVPAPHTLDRLLRYETAIERQLYRAHHELQRLQTARAGQPVPPPAAVDVDVAGSGERA